MGFLCASAVKESTCNSGDMGDIGLIPESGRSLVVGKGNPLQYSYWENPMDKRAWWGLQSMGSQRVGHD